MNSWIDRYRCETAGSQQWAENGSKPSGWAMLQLRGSLKPSRIFLEYHHFSWSDGRCLVIPRQENLNHDKVFRTFQNHNKMTWRMANTGIQMYTVSGSSLIGRTRCVQSIALRGYPTWRLQLEPGVFEASRQSWPFREAPNDPGGLPVPPGPPAGEAEPWWQSDAFPSPSAGTATHAQNTGGQKKELQHGGAMGKTKGTKREELQEDGWGLSAMECEGSTGPLVTVTHCTMFLGLESG